MAGDIIEIENPFGAPVYHVLETVSTMNDARMLAASGAIDGTAVYADYQSAGRGRIEGRVWESKPGENLLCTVLLNRQAVAGFTLRVGLAVSRTYDAFLPPGTRTAIKWPNDVLHEGKKLAGILCENDGATIFVGTGLNIAQTNFPPELKEKAGSLATVSGKNATIPTREDVLARYLLELKAALENPAWHEEISARLWGRGERIAFLAGDPGKNEMLDGTIEGIGASGELLFRLAETSAGAIDRLKQQAAGGTLKRIFSGEIPIG